MPHKGLRTNMSMASLDVRAEIEALAEGLSDLCGNYSVRDDENGPFVLAFGLRDVHSLELRWVGDEYQVELWHGATAAVERLIELVQVKTRDEAISRARAWLRNDAV